MESLSQIRFMIYILKYSQINRQKYKFKMIRITKLNFTQQV
jgi:hypothetical protein